MSNWVRFRYNGLANNRPWRVSSGIRRLGQQVELAWPLRHPKDGTVASSGHSKYPVSDHGIDPLGFVRAIDIGVDDAQGELLVTQLVANRDHRVAYIIYKNQIWRSYQTASHHPEPWTPAPYTKGGHEEHVHVSLLRDGDDNDGSVWNIVLNGENMLTIKDLQRLLNAAGQTDPDGNPLDEDGDLGPKTEFAAVNAFRAFEMPFTWRDIRQLVDRKTRNLLARNDTVNLRYVAPPEEDDSE